ncbi:MAG TPA: hypothetical protein VGK89_13490 [Candidatus Eisenbacteria bacterium]
MAGPHRIVRCAALAALLFLPRAARAAEAMEDPGCGVIPLVAREGALAYALPHSFLRPGSDSLWTRAGPLRRGRDYDLDALRGQVRLTAAPIPGDTLWVSACWLLHPPPLGLRLMSYRPRALAAADSAAPEAAPPPLRPGLSRDPTAAPAGASLSVTGNKTLAVEFGSAQDAFLRQSLDLALSGTLAPGVQLTGVLSDRNTPLTESGSTQDLQSLDRVLIELKTPQGSAALGDVTLTLPEGEFGRLERRLQGVRAEWGGAGFQGTAAAASAQGEYNRMQFLGVEGRQGPYTLTDRDGANAVSVVAGSEIVTVDGARMTRGEGADYSIDYERAQITFSNRRPISSASRITVEYQFAVNRFRRNLAAIDGRWQGGTAHAFTRVLSEGDDRGRPLDLTLDAADRLALQFAGDSASRALSPGVTPGGGDYDTVRTAQGALAYAYAGADSGAFAVRFARIGPGRGDYADSASVSGRTAYRYAGAGHGDYVVGRALPLPETHQLWVVGGGARLGAVSVEAEGAVSRRDLNAFSTLDDGDNLGQAGRASVALEGALPRGLGQGGLALLARGVGRRFAAFSRLDRPFAQEDWGLPVAADLEHQQRFEVTGHWKPEFGGELRASLARLGLPGGFESLRRAFEWAREGKVALRGSFERADAKDPARRFRDGGRERARGELRLRLPWLEPALRAESDERRTPGDSAQAGERVREGALELASAPRFAWHARSGFTLRRSAALGAAGFADRDEARTWNLGFESPAGKAWTGAVALQRRDFDPVAGGTRSRSDLASVRLKADDAKRNWNGSLDLEVTSEGESRRTRTLVFAGSGLGQYDALGNFVGRGDYVLGEGVADGLDRVARAALSARIGWQFGPSDAWRGSRLEFAFEGDARRRGELRASDAVISPGAALTDGALARAAVLQRLECELAPASHAGAVRLFAERRVSADRGYDNYAQTVDQRALEARWRARPATTVTAELASRLKRQEAAQSLLGGAGYARVLIESGGSGQIVVTPDARLRAAGTVDASWVRPEGQPEYTRTLKLGPDLGLAVGPRGRIELGARRSFVQGPPVATLLPVLDALAPARWEGTSRFDYRVRESTTVALSLALRDAPRGGTITTGRAELRAFF